MPNTHTPNASPVHQQSMNIAQLRAALDNSLRINLSLNTRLSTIDHTCECHETRVVVSVTPGSGHIIVDFHCPPSKGTIFVTEGRRTMVINYITTWCANHALDCEVRE